MTKGLFTSLVLLAVPLCGLASICPTTTYDQVIAGGDCSIADKTFGSWSFSSSASGGATLVQASTVVYKPLPTPNNPGVFFSFGFGAGIGQVQDHTFGFTVTVSAGADPITDIHLLMLGPPSVVSDRQALPRASAAATGPAMPQDSWAAAF